MTPTWSTWSLTDADTIGASSGEPDEVASCM